jgi:cyclopropane fatty-acyl-phospholipid synthase-like methyltransferase
LSKADKEIEMADSRGEGNPMCPVDVATNDTVKFVQAHLPAGPLRILEIGCGRGEVAVELQKLGHRVIALDADAASVEQAKSTGVDARQVRWPDFEEAPFDAILFTRSLHHISPLAEAVDHSRRMLLPQGVLIVEDFAYETIDRKTSEGVYGLARLLKTCGMLQGSEGFIQAFVESGGAFDHWHQNHPHDLHTAQAIRTELQRVFSQVTEEKTAQLYRYFLATLPQDEQGQAIAADLFEIETRMGEAGGIELIGRRFIAHI